MEKECTRCHVVKPLGEFYERKGYRYRYGTTAMCKACYKDYYRPYVRMWHEAKRVEKQCF